MKKRCLFIFLIAFSFYGQEKSPPSSNPANAIEIEVETLLDSSTVNYDRGNFATSLRLNIQAIEKAKKTNNTTLLSKAYRYVAYDYLIIDDTALAKSNFEKAKNYAVLSNNNTRQGESYMDLGNFYSSAMEDYSKANEFYDKAILIFEEANDSLSLMKTYFNIVVNSMQAEDFPTAKKYLELIEGPSYNKFLGDSYRISMSVYWTEYYFKFEKNYKKTIAFGLASIVTAKEKEHLNDLELLYLLVSDAYYMQQNYKQALDYRKLYDEVSLLNFETAKKAISETASAKFQIEQYEKSLADAQEKTRLQAEITSNKSRLNNALIIVCVLFLLLLVYIFNAYNKRKALNVALIKKNKEYQEAKEKSEHLATVKNKFFATVSHELRTPLYGVIGISSILLEDIKLKDHKEDLNSLKFSANYLLALINELLHINKIDSNKYEVQLSSFDLRELIKSITTTVEYIRIQNKNSITLDIHPETPQYVLGNRVRLSQILMNLIGNACKFTEDGTITITILPLKIHEESVLLRFSIKDTGIGIAKELQEQIFDEFTQIENLNYTYQGNGLGLTIVKKLLNLSGSEITCISELDKGTEFLFDLEFSIDKNKVTLSEEKQILDESVLKNKKILIVEDNRINQIVTKKILEHKGMVCDLANDGLQAISFVKNKDYDLILMDLNMPNKNGFEASLAIREFNTTIPIIALTAVEVEEVRDKIYKSKMNAIVVKPYDTTKFITTLLNNFTK